MSEILIAFFGVFFVTWAISPITNKLGLTDKPDHRKKHMGTVPLVGGIAIFATTALAAMIFVPPSHEMTYLLAACALLTMTGSVDDRYDIHYQIRLAVQTFTAAVLIWGSNSYLEGLGNLFGFGDIALNEWIGIPLTIIGVIGMINAFNMIDGIDGLAGGLALIASVSLFILIGDQIADGASNILLLMIGALGAYLVMNLHLLPRLTPKIFMGDAGSMLLGFIITAFLVRYSQGSKQVMMPVTALWLVAVPLMDIFVTCIRRVRHGKNPFHPDRTHVHHIFMRAGLSNRSTLLLILSIQAIAAAIGIVLEILQAPDFLSLICFVGLFLAYLQFIKHAFKAAKWMRRTLRKETPGGA